MHSVNTKAPEGAHTNRTAERGSASFPFLRALSSFPFMKVKPVEGWTFLNFKPKRLESPPKG
ncbi:MAG: hypothetical protein ACTS4V_00845 [Candidatus Hodgkinia cicadicola]